MSGGTGVGELPVPGSSVQMVCAGSEVVVGRRIGEGGQGVVHEARVGDRTFALKWLRPSPANEALRAAVAELTGRRPHPAFVWPIDLVAAPTLQGFGYLMPLVGRRFVPFGRLLNGEPPPLRTLLRIGIEVVDAFAALHSLGLCYRDINFHNVLVDPARAEVAILDVDNVGVDGGAAFVKGTHQFMAPEIVRGEALPSTATDLYSLAVFLFYLFVHGHPLEGRRSIAAHSWAPSEHVSETDLVLRSFGTEPLFVFDPDDDANRPLPGSPVATWWRLYPRSFQRLFERSFTTGLADASLTGRVIEATWRRALRRLLEAVHECACGAGVLLTPDEAGRRCWHCDALLDAPCVLRLPGADLLLREGSVVTSHHLCGDGRHDLAVAAVERAPAGSAHALALRNLSERSWTADPGDGPRAVEPHRLLGVRPLHVDFGEVCGEIAVPHPGGAGRPGDASPLGAEILEDQRREAGDAPSR